MTQPWIVANWKMNGTAEHVRWAAKVWQEVELSCHMVFCPPVCWAHLVKPLQPNFHLGGQNCHAASSGAYTGHTSAAMLKEVGCSFVIIGHSEQRASGQTDEDVRAALIQAHQNGLTPIWCMGHRPTPVPPFTIDDECQHITHMIENELPPFKEYIVAYEPISAIGTGAPMAPSDVGTIVQHIKKYCDVPVLYGGSVNQQNIPRFLNVADGALIGSMSLDIQAMAEMLHSL